VENRTYLSLFSGIESATVALESLGYKALGFAEIAPFASAVLAHHYPEVPNFGDITTLEFEEKVRDLRPQILIGGSPCQAFSLSGLRQSLNDARGNLTLTFLKIADLVQAPIIIWENVTGVLNTKDNAFGNFITGLAFSNVETALTPSGKTWAKAGYLKGDKRTLIWRTLNSKYFNTAQNRSRVFAVAVNNDFLSNNPTFHPLSLFEINKPEHDFGKKSNIKEEGIFCTSQDITPRAVYSEVAYTLRAGNHGVNTVFNEQDDKLYSLSPGEMEQLMGFKEGYTDISFKGKKATFSQRATVLGNSFVSTIIYWIVAQLHNPNTDANLLQKLSNTLLNDGPVFEYTKFENFCLYDLVYWINAGQGNSHWDEVKLSDIVKFGGIPLSPVNTMGIVDRIDRKLKMENIKPKALIVLEKLHKEIYSHIKNKLLQSDTLYNIEVGFLIKWAESNPHFTEIKSELLKIHNPMTGVNGDGNLGKLGYKLSYSEVEISGTLKETLLTYL
jgi:DNA (cytosine-5)-methyltransferase 1